MPMAKWPSMAPTATATTTTTTTTTNFSGTAATGGPNEIGVSSTSGHPSEPPLGPSSVSSTSTSGWRQRQKPHLPRIKICFLGSAAVGKTQLIRRFVHGDFDAILTESEAWTPDDALLYSPAISGSGRFRNREYDVPLYTHVSANGSSRYSSKASSKHQGKSSSRPPRSRTTPSRQSQAEVLFKLPPGSGSASRSNTPVPRQSTTAGSRPPSTLSQDTSQSSHLPTALALAPLTLQSSLSSTSALFGLSQPNGILPSATQSGNKQASPPPLQPTAPSSLSHQQHQQQQQQQQPPTPQLALSTERTTVSFNGRLFELDLIELPEIATLPRNNAQEWALFKGTACLRTAHAFVLVFDLSLPATFQYVKAVHDQLCDLRSMSGIPVWVLGNKSDLCIPLLNSQRSHHHHHHQSKSKKIAPLAYELPLGVSSGDETVMHSLLHPHLHSVGVTSYGAATSGAPPPCPYDDLTPAFKDLGAIVRKQWKCSYLECSAKYNWHVTAVYREIVKNVQANDAFQAENFPAPITSGSHSHFRSASGGEHLGNHTSSGNASGGTIWNQNQFPATPTRRPKMCVIF